MQPRLHNVELSSRDLRMEHKCIHVLDEFFQHSKTLRSELDQRKVALQFVDCQQEQLLQEYVHWTIQSIEIQYQRELRIAA